MTVADVVKWVLKHRRGRAFKDMSVYEIRATIHFAVQSGGFIYTTDNHGHLTGLAVFVKDEETKTATTGPVLTITRDSIGAISKHFLDKYTDWHVRIHHRLGGISTRDGTKVLQRLSNRKN